MTIFVEWDAQFETYEIGQSSGLGKLTTASTRDKAIKKAKKYRQKSENIVIKGPQMNKFKDL